MKKVLIVAALMLAVVSCKKTMDRPAPVRSPYLESVIAQLRDSFGQGMPNRFYYEFHKTRLLYEYHTLLVPDFTDEELIKSTNPFDRSVLPTAIFAVSPTEQ